MPVIAWERSKPRVRIQAVGRASEQKTTPDGEMHGEPEKVVAVLVR